MNGVRRCAIGLVGALALANLMVVAAAASDPDPPVADAATPRPLAVAAHWEMNERSGTVMTDSGPYGFNGTIGSAVVVNGAASGATGYRWPFISSPTAPPAKPERLVTVPDDPSRRLDPELADYAIEFRYRTTRSFGNIVQKGQNTHLGGYWKFEQPRGYMTCLFKWTDPANPANSIQIGVSAPETVDEYFRTNDGQWHTIRCELRRNFGVILFIDGEEAAKKAGTLPSINNDKVISIGGKNSCDQITATCDYFDGDIDYIRIEKGPSTNVAPQMDFEATCDDLDCSFDASASRDPDGRIVEYRWDYGDNFTRTDDDPLDNRTYATAGTYQVTLTGTDDRGQTSSVTKPVTTNLPPTMAFTSTCDELRCTFDASGSTDPDGTIRSWRWTFGAGTTPVTETDPQATFTFRNEGRFTVTLRGTDDDGATAEISQSIDVARNRAPTARFTSSCTGTTCTFDASTSSDPDGTIAAAAWSFGGGGSATGISTAHTFAAGGTFPVTVTVTDDKGATATATQSLTVVQQASLPPGLRSTRLVPLPPTRIFDTREGEAAPGPKGQLAPGATITVDVTDIGGVPADAAAVVLNLTAIGIDPGFVTAFPTGTPRPTASSLNIVEPGQVRANLVVVPVGDDGTISLFSLGTAHLLGDVAGYFVPQSTATAAGRIITRAPQRLFDTRPGPDPGPKGTVGAGGTIEVPVLGQAGVPATGVSAVVLTLTATAPQAPGFVTVWSGVGAAPGASSLNINVAGETVPNQVIVPVGPNGSISLFASSATELLADVSGYVTGATATPALTGLFVPLPPARLFDTRPGEPGNGPKALVPAGGTIDVDVAGVAGVPADAGAVVMNLTMIGTGPSFATAWPQGVTRPTTSTVNVSRNGDVRANGATLALGASGDLSMFVSSDAHLLADVSGYLIR